MEIPVKGYIKTLVKDFGFIRVDSMESDYFFHSSYVQNYKSLKIGDEVSCILRSNRRGTKTEAYEIKVINSLNKDGQAKKKRIKRTKFKFDNKSDAILGLNYIREKLSVQASAKSLLNYDDGEIIEAEINEIIHIIDDLLDGPTPNIDDIDISHLNNFEDKKCKRSNFDYWLNSFNIVEFGQAIENVSSIEVSRGRKNNTEIIWHEWKSKTRQVFSAGYHKGYFNYSFIEIGQSEQISVYNNPPPKATWQIRKIEQKGKVFYLGSAPVNQIAQSCMVPALPPSIGIIETANRILNRQHKTNEWQREVDKDRMLKISQFIGENNNVIANTPMLFIKDDSSVEIGKDSLTIDFTNFLKKQRDGSYVDRIKRKDKDEFGNDVFDDFRPLWLIDGQHRVKGIHRNEEFQSIEIPIIIFPSDFGISDTAKVFAEINTLQKKLNPLHELFMQHRFSIDHVNRKRKFRNISETSIEDAEREGWYQDWLYSRANHLSYEILAMLSKDGPLKDKVQFLPQNGNSDSILVSADQWLNYSSPLFLDKCYRYKGDSAEFYIRDIKDEELNLSEKEIFFQEINNYFKAWVATCNHSDWSDKKKRWPDGPRGKSLLQKKTNFIILIELYNLVYQAADNYRIDNQIKGLLTKEVFMEVLTPFKNVDWINRDLEKVFSGGGERGRRSLEAWMADAIINGEQYSSEEILDSKLKSQPGRGITATLGKPTIVCSSNNHWPDKNTVVQFSSLRPYNARNECKWLVTTEEGDILAEGKSSVSKHTNPSEAVFNLKYTKEMKELERMIVRVDWQNSQTKTGWNSMVIKYLS